MYKFIIEYWFYRNYFDKDYEHITIVAKNERQAMDTMKKQLKKFFFATKVISVTPLI
jgi:hypothetical protein